jgi:O-antigen ligase
MALDHLSAQLTPLPNAAKSSVAPRHGALGERARAALFLAILLAAWITTDPFPQGAVGAPASSSANLINQLVFVSLAALAAAALWSRNAGVLRPLLQPSYGLVIFVLVFSLAQSIQPADALRALVFSLIVAGLAATLYALPRDGVHFRNLLFAAAAITVGLSWLGVLIWPEIAIHSDVDPIEPEHAGSWRGHFTHKNIAGAMMAVMGIIGLYAWRSGQRRLGLAILVGAVLFLYLTRSKTSFGLFPVVVILVLVAERIPFLLARLALLIGPVLALNLLTLGSALSPDIRALNQALLSDPSFTGRYDIWRFGFEKLAERPWTGFGYESFWMTDLAKYGESKLELAWSVGGIVHGHNSYLDMAIALGWPGLAVIVYAFVLKPVLDFHRAKPTRENRLLASAACMIWLFVSLCMCLEVFYFRRADPIWVSLLIAVFALRLAASYRLAEPARTG